MSAGSVLGLEVMGPDRFEAMFFTAALISTKGAVMGLLVRFPQYARPENHRFKWSSLLAVPALTVSLNMLILAMTYGGILTFVGVHATENGLAEFTGWFFTVTAIGTALTRIFSGHLFDRYGPTWISVFGIISVSAGLMLLGQAPVPFLFLLSGFVIGIGFGVIFPTLQTMANNVASPEHRGSANSTFLTGLDMGIALGAVLTGMVSSVLSLAWTFKAASLITLAGLVFFLVFSLPHYTKNRNFD
jgi:MFS family permease